MACKAHERIVICVTGWGYEVVPSIACGMILAYLGDALVCCWSTVDADWCIYVTLSTRRADDGQSQFVSLKGAVDICLYRRR
jgi:hypothetical protein